MSSNQAQDRYNPPKLGENDYESTSFSELNVGELLWLNTSRGDGNHAYRKLNEGQALKNKTQKTHNFNRTTKVYYKM